MKHRKVKKGDLISPIFKGKSSYVTSKKVYGVIRINPDGKGFWIKADDKDDIFCLIENCAFMDSVKGRWIIKRKPKIKS